MRADRTVAGDYGMLRSPLQSPRAVASRMHLHDSALGKAVAANQRPQFAFAGYQVPRLAAATVLLAAAVLKIHALWTGLDLAATGILSSRWIQIATVEVEMLLGLSLLLDLWPRITWAAALLVFIVFSAVSLTKLIGGAQTCGCFGGVVVHPAWSLALDVVLVIALGMFRPFIGTPLRWNFANPPTTTRDPKSAIASRLPQTRFVPLSIAALVAATLGMHQPAVERTRPGIDIIDGRYAIVEPDSWEGQEFPLLDYIDIRQQLATGNWTVLIYEKGCPACSRALHTLNAMETGSRSGEFHVAVVQIPPHREVLTSADVVIANLTDEVRWFIPTPLWIDLEDGRITHVRNSPSS